MPRFHEVGGFLSTDESFSNTELVTKYHEGIPDYPKELLEAILANYSTDNGSKPIKVAIDIGCGSGQYTRIISPYCEKVIGIDPSRAMIIEAERHRCEPSEEYKVGTCLDLKVPDNSVDLITVGNAIHRFEKLEEFYREADRVLRPGGLLAYFGICVYDEGDLPAENILVKYLSHPNYLGSHFPACINSNFRKYTDIKPPYADNKRFDIVITKPSTTAKSVMMIERTTALYHLRSVDPKKAELMIQEFIDEYATAYNPATLGTPAALDITFDLRVQFFGYICHKPKDN